MQAPAYAPVAQTPATESAEATKAAAAGGGHLLKYALIGTVVVGAGVVGFGVFGLLGGALSSLFAPLSALLGVGTSTAKAASAVIGQAGQTIATVINPDSYTTKTASFCCDVFATSQLVSALSREVVVPCNPSCDHNRCNGGRCGCQITNSQFYSTVPDAQSKPVTKPHASVEPALLLCDSNLTSF